MPAEWRLSASEAVVFGVLWTRRAATRDAIMAALYHDIGRDEADIKVLDVYVHKLRRKLAPFGVGISTVPGQGWELTREGRERARELLAEAEGGFNL